MARYSGLLLRVFTRDHPAMGPGKAQLVELIAATGSIAVAAREIAMAYRCAWEAYEI
ncbi:MAG: hypothetical protein Q8L95_08185 [Burkholderiales bacterium]|nr:hypothetical protein [Burkholderiales bacterium]